MKIYSKQNFKAGLLLVLLGILLMVVNTIKGFEVKSCILSILCLFFGIGAIIRSLSREMTKKDIINEQDERNQLITLKSRSKSFTLTQRIIFILMLLFFVTAKVKDNEIFIYIGLGLSIIFWTSLLIEFFTTIYYKHRI